MVDMIEGHPIPQDITGFQFRLIGDMTVKQFAYVIVGLVAGWLIFSLPVFFIIKVPIAAVVALTGIIFAFMPIQGIPADTLLLLFFKALFSPNQYVYQKQGDLSQPETSNTKIAAITQQKDKKVLSPFLKSTSAHQSAMQSEGVKKPEIIFTQTNTGTNAPNSPQTTNLSTKAINNTPHVSSVTVNPVSPSYSSMNTLPTSQLPIINSTPPANPFEQQLQEILKQKEQLERQLERLTQQNSSSSSPQTKSEVIKQPTEPNPYKKVLDLPDKKTMADSFMPDVPNLIAGIVKDSRGNVLPNILVEVKDKDDNPVRAFKTNALGQFVSATQLVNGTYTILFEDPKKQQRFDTIELAANGAILPLLEVISIDEREDLRKTLFNS